MTFVFMSVFSRPSSRTTSRTWLLGLAAILAVELGFRGATAQADPRGEAAIGSAGSAQEGAARRLASSRQVRLDTMVRQGDTFSARLEGGAQAELTLDPRLQDAAEEVFQTFQLPYAGRSGTQIGRAHV